MWCVPTYGNPTGYSFTEAEVRALVEMPSAAPDFTLMWDNAYAVHHLTDDEAPVYDVLGLAAAAGHPDRPIVFASTSKITFAGGGVGFVGGSPGDDRVDPQLLGRTQHRSGQDQPAAPCAVSEGCRRRAGAHAREPRPAGAEVRCRARDPRGRLGGAAEWTRPKGGYFITLEAGEGCATRADRPRHRGGRRGDGVRAHRTPMAMTRATRPSGSLRVSRRCPNSVPAIDALCTCILLAQAERSNTSPLTPRHATPNPTPGGESVSAEVSGTGLRRHPQHLEFVGEQVGDALLERSSTPRTIMALASRVIRR